MKKLIYILVFFASIIGTNSVSAADFWGSGVTNLIIYSPNGAETSTTFEWRTYDNSETTQVSIWPSGTTGSASGTNIISSKCANDNNSTIHCITFSNLISGRSYDYEITTIAGPSMSDYTYGSFTAGILKEPQKKISFEKTTADSTEKSIRKGETAIYELEFANTGNFDDSYTISAYESSPLISTSITTAGIAEIRPGKYSGKIRLIVTADSDSSIDQSVSSSVVIRSFKDSSKTIAVPFSVKVLASQTTSTTPPPPPDQSTTTPPPTPQVYNRTISGRVSYSDLGNSPVTDAKVVAYNQATNDRVPTRVDANGKYTLTVTEGTWKVNVIPTDKADWSQEGLLEKDAVFTSSGATSATVDFTIVRPNARFTAYVKKPDGTAAVGVRVAVVKSNVSEKARGKFIGQSENTDASGAATFSLNPGDYQVRVAVASASGFVEADRPSVSLANGDNKSVTIQLKQAMLYLSGTVKHADGRPAPALVWGWSESGGSSEVKASASGEFSMPVTRNSKWHVGAGRMEGNSGHKSSEIVVNVGEFAPARIELVIERLKVDLPQPVQAVKPANENATASVSTGAKVEVPAGAAAVSGSITIDVKPTVEVAAPTLTKIVGTVYDIDIKDQSGNKVSTFSKDLVITFPYDEKTLTDLAVRTNELRPSFYDEKTGDWVELIDYTLDPIGKKVIARVPHLTRFALIAAADITPPAAPTNVTASKVGPNIQISWVNPKTDFRHAKIYKSTNPGELGTIVFGEVFEPTTTKLDTNVIPGKTYYYVVRSVDPAGNESTNTLQAVATQLGQVVSAFNRSLKLGASGDDVALLQQILVKEGVYPEGIVSRYFGNLTLKAVVRLQDKYKSEVLSPAGLTKGSGYVGSYTLKKLSELKAKHSL